LGDTSGHVVHAAVQSDVPPSRGALACIGNQLTAAIVPAFDGSDVTLSKTVFVTGGVPVDEGEYLVQARR
jgi:hypothetical protein